jgi:hypothetical protein
LSDLNDAHNTLVGTVNPAQDAINKCGDNDLKCFESGDAKIAGGFADFKSSLEDIDFPDAVSDQVDAVDSASEKFANDAHSLATAPTAQDFLRIAGNGIMTEDSKSFGSAYDALVSALRR